jgi:hypothetical protein
MAGYYTRGAVVLAFREFNGRECSALELDEEAILVQGERLETDEMCGDHERLLEHDAQDSPGRSAESVWKQILRIGRLGCALVGAGFLADSAGGA